MTDEQSDLVRRIRALIASESGVREVPMFGGRAIMVGGKMIASANKDGSLLVRVDAAQRDELLDKQGADQAEMGEGRTMGPGWITVAANALAGEHRLAFWIDAAMAYNRTIKDPRS